MGCKELGRAECFICMSGSLVGVACLPCGVRKGWCARPWAGPVESVCDSRSNGHCQK